MFWTFKNYGYPSSQKIGLWNDKTFLIVPVIFNHMAGSKNYASFKNQLIAYVKRGDCPPDVLATMVDRYNHSNNNPSEYGFEYTVGLEPKYKIDTVLVNRNRRKIGLPSIKHYRKMQVDFAN